MASWVTFNCHKQGYFQLSSIASWVTVIHFCIPSSPPSPPGMTRLLTREAQVKLLTIKYSYESQYKSQYYSVARPDTRVSPFLRNLDEISMYNRSMPTNDWPL